MDILPKLKNYFTQNLQELPESIDIDKIENAFVYHCKIMSNHVKNENCDELIEYILRKLPQKVMLSSLMKKNNKFYSDKLQKISNTVDKLLIKAHKRINETINSQRKQKNQLTIQIKRNFLEAWYRYSPDMHPSLKIELTKHIINDCDDSPEWLYFSITHLD